MRPFAGHANTVALLIASMLMMSRAEAADDGKSALSAADQATAAHLAQVLDDPVERAKLVAELRLLGQVQSGAAAIQNAGPSGGPLLGGLPAEMASVGQNLDQDLTLGGSALAGLRHQVTLLQHRIADPLWRRTTMAAAARGSAWTLAAVGVAWLVRRLIRRIGRRVLRDDRHTRVLPRLLDGVLLVLTVMFICYAWGADSMAWAMSVVGRRLVIIAVAVTLGVVLWEWLTQAIDRFVSRTDAQGQTVPRSSRALTLLPLARNIAKVTLTIIIGLVILSAVGIDIGPLLAGASVIGVAIGFGSQKLVQDVITGAFILLEDSVAVGDFVKIGEHAGQVEGMTARTMRLRDASGQLHSIPFSSITQIINQSRDVGYHVFEFVVPVDSDLDGMTALLRGVGESLRQDPVLGNDVKAAIELFGIEKLNATGASFTGRLKTHPGRQLSVGCAFNRRVIERMAAEGITLAPPPQLIYMHGAGAVAAPDSPP